MSTEHKTGGMKIDVPAVVAKGGPNEWCCLVHDFSNLQRHLWIWAIMWLALTNRGWWKWHRHSQTWFLRGASIFYFCDLQGNSKSFRKEVHPPAEITWRGHEEWEMLCVYMERGEMDSHYSSWDLLPSCSSAKTPDTGTHHPRDSHLLEIPKTAVTALSHGTENDWRVYRLRGRRCSSGFLCNVGNWNRSTSLRSILGLKWLQPNRKVLF